MAPETIPGSFEKLRTMLADLDGYIDRRAAELAKPLLDQALAEVAEAQRRARAEVQRQEDLVAELRRRLDARDRQSAAEKAADAAGKPDIVLIDIDLLCDAVRWAVEQHTSGTPVGFTDVQRHMRSKGDSQGGRRCLRPPSPSCPASGSPASATSRKAPCPCLAPRSGGIPTRFRSGSGLARVPAAVGEGPWEYEGRRSAAGMRHDYHHPAGHQPRMTICHVRFMTRYECQEIYWRVLTGNLTPALQHHRLPVSVPHVVADLKGKTLACTCPFPARGEADWCHAMILAQIAAYHELARLRCVSRKAAEAVVKEVDRPGTNCVIADAETVVISYCDRRYPIGIAEWALSHGHTTDGAAAAVIAGLRGNDGNG